MPVQRTKYGDTTLSVNGYLEKWKDDSVESYSPEDIQVDLWMQHLCGDDVLNLKVTNLETGEEVQYSILGDENVRSIAWAILRVENHHFPEKEVTDR